MKRTRVVSTALLFLVAGGSAMAQGHGGRGKKPDQSAQVQPAEGKKPDRPAPVPQAEQQLRVQQQQQRATQYKQHLDQQVRVAQQQTAQLQQQKRAAQYRAQQQYAAQLLQQQQRLQTARNYSRDPYISTPHTYRYIVSGTTRQTNQYGADVLRQAVNYGYQEGYRSGQADRQDHWASNYQNSAAYRDANYGYTGNYIDQSDYNYYFRQGFRRGYTDGYNSQSQYGTSSNGTYSILGTVLSSILGLQSIR
jgi:flagellar biosynthesis GTPase FlhF